MNILLTTLNAKYIHKNLALRYLYVTKPDGFSCEIKEFTIKDDIDRIVSELLARKDDVIGFSTYIWNIAQTSVIVQRLKQERPELIIVLGGPEVSFDGAHFVEQLGVDAVVCGEGEFVFWEYLSQMKQQKEMHASNAAILSHSSATSTITSDIAGVFTQTTTPRIRYAMVDLKQLERYPKPYFLSFDEAHMHNRYFYVETSRGCPYRCRYCLSSVQGNVRMFSQPYVEEVLDQVFASAARQIKFLDRTFNVDKHRALYFASYIQDHAKTNQIFQFEIMAEYVSDELIAYLKQKPKLPQFRFEIGIQSTNQRSLQEIDRVQNFDRLCSVIHQLQSTGYHELHVDLIAGLPYEDIASFRKSFNDVFALGADEVQLGFLKLLRGTTLRRQAVAYGMKYDCDAPYEVSQTKWVSESDMEEIHDVCFALDALYNTPRLKTTIPGLLGRRDGKTISDCNHGVGMNEMKSLNPYQLFFMLGKPMRQNKYRQLDELFAMVYDVLVQFWEPNLIQAMLANDYYALFKQRPKRFVKDRIDQESKAKMYGLLTHHHTINELMHYGLFDRGYYEENGIGYAGYQFVLYNKHQTYPLRYIIDKDGRQARLLEKENNI